MSQCHVCTHRALRSIGNFALWGCLKRKIKFGNDTDWYAGKNQPKSCAEFEVLK